MNFLLSRSNFNSYEYLEKYVDKVTNCHVVYQGVGMCHTLERNLWDLFCTSHEGGKQGDAFETKDKHHEKYKTWVQVVLQMGSIFSRSVFPHLLG